MRIGIAVLAYGCLVCLAAYRREKGYPLLFRFLEGYILAFLCFYFLPQAFEQVFFLKAGIAALLGIGCAAWLERVFQKQERARGGFRLLIFVLLAITQGFMPATFSMGLVRAWLGGMGLYAASEGLLPEDGGLEELVYAGVGGILGFLLGAYFGFC